MELLICVLYLLGGITIGYYISKWKTTKRRGVGRWD